MAIRRSIRSEVNACADIDLSKNIFKQITDPLVVTDELFKNALPLWGDSPLVALMNVPPGPKADALSSKGKKARSLIFGGKAVMMSDTGRVREWWRTRYYQELFRRLRMDYTLGVCLFLRHGRSVTFTTERSSKQGDFTERDRAVFDLLIPHMKQAITNSERIAKLAHDGRSAVFFTDGSGRIESRNELGRIMLRERFAAPSESGVLPPEMAAWVKVSAAAFEQWAEVPEAPRPLPLNLPGAKMTARITPSLSEGGYWVEIEECPVRRRGILSPEDIGLSPRQKEILRWVSCGKTNAETAAILGISPLTVRKHLENIYDKLDVPNRAAASSVLALIFGNGSERVK